MKTMIKIFLAALFVFLLSGCKEKTNDDNKIIYPDIEKFDYSTLESMNAYTIIDNLKYEYTFYFEDDVCINALVKIEFKTNEEALSFYNGIKDSVNYYEVNINDNIIQYYHDIENFSYAMYPKNTLIELIQKEDFVVE